MVPVLLHCHHLIWFALISVTTLYNPVFAQNSVENTQAIKEDQGSAFLILGKYAAVCLCFLCGTLLVTTSAHQDDAWNENIARILGTKIRLGVAGFLLAGVVAFPFLAVTSIIALPFIVVIGITVTPFLVVAGVMALPIIAIIGIVLFPFIAMFGIFLFPLVMIAGVFAVAFAKAIFGENAFKSSLAPIVTACEQLQRTARQWASQETAKSSKQR